MLETTLPFLNRRLLVVVMGQFSVRAVLVEKKQNRQMEISQFSEVTFEASIKNPKVKMARLMEAMGPVPVRDVVIVTGEVRLLAADLPKPATRRFSSAAMDSLREGARWEIAPFLDFSADMALIRLLMLPEEDGWTDEDEAFDDYTDISASRQPALIFAAPQAVYAGLSAICKAHKMRLRGVMAEECFAFAAGPAEALDRDVLLMEGRVHDVLGALIKNGLPVRIQRESIGGGETAAAALARLAAGLAEDSEEVEEIILGGEAAEAGPTTGDTSAAGNLPVRTWRIEEDLPGLQTPGPLPARYMSAVAAGVNCLDKKGRRILVNDDVSLKQRVKDNIHALPLILLLVFIIVIGGVYVHLKHKQVHLKKRIESLTQEKTVLEEDANQESALKNRHARLKDHKQEVLENMDLLLRDMPRQNRRITGLLTGMMHRTPPDIQITKISQFSGAIFFIEGQTLHFPSVTQYLVRLKTIDNVVETRLEGNKAVTAGPARGGKAAGRGKNAGAAIYRFSIRVKLEV